MRLSVTDGSEISRRCNSTGEERVVRAGTLRTNQSLCQMPSFRRGVQWSSLRTFSDL